MNLNTPPKNPIVRYGILLGLYWMTFNTMLTFANMLYKHHGLTNYEIGIAGTCVALSNVIAQPIWGLICDRMPRIKKVFCIGLIGAMLGTSIQLFNESSGWLIVLSMCLVNFCYMPLFSMLDAWINRMNANGMKINYGPTRAFGSVGGAVASLVFGVLIDQLGVGIIAPCFIALSLVLLIYMLTLYEPPAVVAHSKKDAKNVEDTFWFIFKKLLKNKQYLILVFTYMLSYIGLSCVITFSSVKIADLGGGFFETGIVFFICAMCEIVFLVFFPKISKYIRPQGIIMIGFFFVTFRIITLALAGSVPQIWLAAVLHGPSYGIMIGGVVAYMSAVVDRKSLFTAQTCFAAAWGIGQIIGNYIGGLLSSAYSIDTMFYIMSSLSAAAFVLMAVNFLTLHRKSKQEV